MESSLHFITGQENRLVKEKAKGIIGWWRGTCPRLLLRRRSQPRTTVTTYQARSSAEPRLPVVSHRNPPASAASSGPRGLVSPRPPPCTSAASRASIGPSVRHSGRRSGRKVRELVLESVKLSLCEERSGARRLAGAGSLSGEWPWRELTKTAAEVQDAKQVALRWGLQPGSFPQWGGLSQLASSRRLGFPRVSKTTRAPRFCRPRWVTPPEVPLPFLSLTVPLSFPPSSAYWTSPSPPTVFLVISRSPSPSLPETFCLPSTGWERLLSDLKRYRKCYRNVSSCPSCWLLVRIDSYRIHDDCFVLGRTLLTHAILALGILFRPWNRAKPIGLSNVEARSKTLKQPLIEKTSLR